MEKSFWLKVECATIARGACAVCLLATFLTTGRALAQTTAGTIAGQVKDSSGAAIPGATVTVTSLTRDAVRTIQTSADGLFSLPNLPPGHYRVEGARSGFTTYVNPDVELNVYQALTIDMTLQLSAVSEKVTVTATPPPLQTQDASIGQVVAHEQVVQLPLNGRQFTELILLTPGAAPLQSGQQTAFTIALGAGGLSPAVNGQSPNSNNFTLDGLENNARFDNTYAISPPPDAIAEFNVLSHIDDARFALAAGANVNVATRSGTDNLHGDAWEFLRNDALDARNFFDLEKLLPNGQPFAPTKPPYRQNQFGATVGGPVVIPGVYDGRRGHTWFFGYYEGFRSRQGFTTFSSVPTPTELGGNFTDLLGGPAGVSNALGQPILKGELFDPLTTRPVVAGEVDPLTGLTATTTGYVRSPLECNGVLNVICPSRLFAASLSYATLYPNPNFTSSLGNLIADQNQPTDNNQFGVRIDHTFRNNDTLFGRFSWFKSTKNGVGALPDTPILQTNIGVSTALGFNHVFDPTFLLNVHLGYLRTGIPVSPKPAGTALVDQIGFPADLRSSLNYAGTAVGPSVSINPRITPIEQWGWGLGNPDYNYQYNFDFTKIKGNHSLSWGLEILHYRHVTQVQPEVPITFDNAATNDPQTEVGGDGLASYLLGLPTDAAQFGFNYTNLSGQIYDGYLQDRWRVTPKLTLSVGLQYDFNAGPNWNRMGNRISTWDPNTGVFLYATTNPFTGAPPNVRSTLFDPVWNDWAPRVGLAYQARPTTVIRASFATFYDHGNNLIQEARDTTTQWPYGPIINQNATALNTYTTGPLSSRQTFSNPLPPILNLSTPIPPNFSVNVRNKVPLANMWMLDVQHAITPNLAIDVAYVGSSNSNVFIQPTANTAVTPGPGNPAPRRPFPDYQPVAFDINLGRSNYSGLQVKITKTYSQGLSFLASYTWSRCFSIGDTRGSVQAQNYYDLNSAYGPCDMDMPQMFVLSYLYSLPFGQGKHFLSSAGGLLNQLIGGWQWGGITTIHTGYPFNITAPYDVANTGAGSQLGSYLTPSARLLPPGFDQTPNHWFNTDPTQIGTIPFTYGNISRNFLRGPGVVDFDMSFVKNFRLAESKMFEFRAEFFNMFNTPAFGQPVGTVGSPFFGEIQSAGPARQIQFGLKFFW
jgi:Carboxypeptidase regulatory-like domain